MTRLDRRALRERLVGGRLERYDASAANSLIGGDEHLRAGVLDPIPERRRREAAEDHIVNRTDARAREHRDGQFGDHRQVDRDSVALLDAVLLEHVGEAADLVVERLVRVDLAATLVAFPDECCLVATPRGEVTVDAVVGDVCLAALEPLDLRGVELPLEDLVPLLVPVEVCLGLLGPEALRILDRAAIHGVVLVHGRDPRMLLHPVWRLDDLTLALQ